MAEDARSFDLGAWATVANSNGVSFPEARLGMMAGRVNQVDEPPHPRSGGGTILARCWPLGRSSDMPLLLAKTTPAGGHHVMRRVRSKVLDKLSNFPVTVLEPEPLGDLKLYQTPERTTLGARQMKQVRLLDRRGIPAELLYVANLTAGEETQLAAHQVLRTVNDEAHDLGVPLPSGSVSTFVREGGTAVLVAEAPLRDLTVGETLEIHAGEAADVQVRAVQEAPSFSRPKPPRLRGTPRWGGQRRMSRIEISNSRGAALHFEARLALGKDEQLVRATVAPLLRDGRWIMGVDIPAGDRVVLQYVTQRPQGSRQALPDAPGGVRF